eukprot:85330-Lingulodinium_polyedra.AAC.1
MRTPHNVVGFIQRARDNPQPGTAGILDSARHPLPMGQAHDGKRETHQGVPATDLPLVTITKVAEAHGLLITSAPRRAARPVSGA